MFLNDREYISTLIPLYYNSFFYNCLFLIYNPKLQIHLGLYRHFTVVKLNYQHHFTIVFISLQNHPAILIARKFFKNLQHNLAVVFLTRRNFYYVNFLLFLILQLFQLVLKIEKSKNLVYNIYIRLREKTKLEPPAYSHLNILREGKPYKPVWVANTPTGARSPRR